VSSHRPRPLDHEIARLALLEDPVRRALYEHVARQADYVGRDQAATAVGVSRSLAAFHLDKLAEEDLLEVTFRRPPGRTGPGAGRPAKLYRRSPQQVSVCLPPRDYELLAELLAAALDHRLPTEVAGALADGARRAGVFMAVEAMRPADDRPVLEAGLEALRRRGFEPHREDGTIVLRNCPFQTVAASHRDLVCPLNLALLEAFVEALGVSGVRARLEPRTYACCVSLDVAPTG
jgi:predicted ArsR family transcriptional regulator